MKQYSKSHLVVILHGFILQLIYTTQNRGINITFNKTFLSVPIEPKKICLLETLMSVEVEECIYVTKMYIPPDR
jgi:hypothetical protein